MTAPSPTTAELRVMAADPAEFQASLIIPAAHGAARFGDVMAPFQRERFAGLNPALVAVATGQQPEPNRFWWEATKGASKDSDLAVALLWIAAFARKPLLAQVGAADQDQAGELRLAAKSILHLNPWLAEQVDVQANRMTCERTGVVCEIIAADTAGSHGARPDVLIVNELSHVTKREFAENLLDNATKVPRGLVVIATNAGFLDTWQWNWREIARTSPRWRFHQWAQPSPWLNPDDIEEAARRNSASRFARLWWGVWASGTGDALSPDDIQAAVVEGLEPLEAARNSDMGFVAGLDLGIRRDHSALVTVGWNPDTQRIRLAEVQSWVPPLGGEIDLEEVLDAVLFAWQRFQLNCVCFDPHQAILLAQQARRYGCPMFEVPFVGKNLDRMASTLLQTFRERRIHLFNDARLLRDLGRLTIVERSFGFRLSAPRDANGHADRATALALALPWAVDAAANYREAPPDDGIHSIFDPRWSAKNEPGFVC